MRMSCNGCRVLRKGCSDNCSIRPCLQWISSPESQANATVFLAKFYGRAGLMNLINAGPEDLRPAIFRSLLYEACGRIVNPIYGSVGLLWSGSWQLCQNAVEAVLRGAPITQMASDAAATDNGPPLKAYDIRHISKDENAAGPNELHRVRTRCRFKRSANKEKASRVWIGSGEEESGHEEGKPGRIWFGSGEESGHNWSSSHESSLSHQSEQAFVLEGESRGLHVPESNDQAKVEDAELELRLGFEPIPSSSVVAAYPKEKKVEALQKLEDEGDENGACRMELGLDYQA